MEKTGKEEPQVAFVLELRPVGDVTRAEAIQRLRAALKTLLRSYRLRCVRIAEAPGGRKDESDVTG